MLLQLFLPILLAPSYVKNSQTHKRMLTFAKLHILCYIHFVLATVVASEASEAALEAPLNFDASKIVLVPSIVSPLRMACAQITENAAKSEEEKLLCQLYESSTLLTQLGTLISHGLDRLLINQGVLENTQISDEVNQNWAESPREKRKHEYLRFGKRKHEYLRFG